VIETPQLQKNTPYLQSKAQQEVARFLLSKQRFSKFESPSACCSEINNLARPGSLFFGSNIVFGNYCSPNCSPIFRPDF
jgi:hypothetical protein